MRNKAQPCAFPGQSSKSQTAHSTVQFDI